MTIYNSVRGFDLGTTENKSGQRSGRELNSMGLFSALVNCTEENIDSLSNSLDVISILSHAV